MSSTFTERINFVQRTLGKGQISRDGSDITVRCPSCGDSQKKKLAINLETWKYHCWVCGLKGNTLVSLLKKHGDRSQIDEFRVTFLNSRILISDAIPTEEQKVELPDGFTPLVTCLSSKNPNVRAIKRYLEKRGLTERELWKFRVGVSESGKFSRRPIFASLDTDGELNYYVSRTIDGKSGLRYLNSTADKTGIVFNDCDIDWDKKVYLVEGIFDLIALKENGTCLLGSSISENSLLFKKIVANESDVVLCLDNDMLKKTGRIADLLESYGCNVEVMNTSAAKDIAEMNPDQLEYSKSALTKWNLAASFKYKIAAIKSGSMF